ncbi:MAG: urease accessory protein UreE [Rhodospirillales bacterium]|nr:urease accessory protein UreE [Rhodospirillales bacterium]
MNRAHAIVPAGEWPAQERRDSVTLAYDDRHRRRMRLTTDEGAALLLDLPQAVVLRDGDGLALDGGGYVVVRAAAEDIVEVTAATPELLARLAWHIGNRHFPTEIHSDCIRIRDDHVMVAMVEGLGARVRRVRAPFNPEGGAYAPAADRHEHTHDHGHHGHDHDH